MNVLGESSERLLLDYVERQTQMGIPEEILPKVRIDHLHVSEQQATDKEVVRKYRTKTPEERRILFDNLWKWSGWKVAIKLEVEDLTTWETELNKIQEEADLEKHQTLWSKSEWQYLWNHSLSEDSHLPVDW